MTAAKRPRARRRPLPSLNRIHTVAFDFDGVFTDNKVLVGADGIEMVRCDRGDGLAFDLVRASNRGEHRVECFILSREAHPVVLARAKKLRLTCHTGVTNKVEFMTDYFRRGGVAIEDGFAGLVYVGNDLNDLALMRRAGYAAAPADAHPRVRAVADFVTKQRGGDGCVRAIVERLFRLDALSAAAIEELLSS